MPLARNAIENALAWLTVLSGLLLAAGVYIAGQSHRSAMSFVELSESQNALVTQLATFTRIQHEMGYTRFIHNFKNGVLRRDVDLLREAQGNIDNALASLDDLLSLNPSLRRLSENLKDTLAAYQDKADLAVTLVGEGVSSTDIDAVVKIDDSPAEADLAALYDAIDQTRATLLRRIDEQTAGQERQTNLEYVKAAALFVLAAVLIWLKLAVRRQVISLLMARDTLSRIAQRFSRQKLLNENEGGGEDLEARIGDLTRRIETQQRDLLQHAEALTAANEELERFAYVASHDLQEPLRRIQSNIDLIELKAKQDGTTLAPDTETRLERIAKAAQQMRQLIRDLLEYSRRGNWVPALQTFSLVALVAEVANGAAESLAAQGGDIQISSEPSEILMSGDRAMLAQVLSNLIGNARKYARPDVPPQIGVHVELGIKEAVLTVTDNGIGFDPKYSEEIFKPFVRLQGRSVASGSGIGLSIVRRVVEKHGGRVDAIGQPGQGATFVVHLPLRPTVELEPAPGAPQDESDQEAAHA